MSDFFSPIRLTGPYVTDSEFWTSDEPPRGALDCSVHIYTKDAELLHEQGLYAFQMRMRTEVSLVPISGGDEVVRAVVTVEGAVSVPDTIGIGLEELSESLHLNAISMFYSFTRSCIESESSLSRMGRFSIPPIDPKKYLDLCDRGEPKF